ncbi:hypothetical protein [Pseudoglutamicibacter cumminsii]|uniref:hypothetical protein n=1 Tax=Pseudoglutamicibacter cumminsii TaxID=156979 RepID=UPI00215B24BB|nr:hypothetical protein [Pseudoglutamicibacter cumminsii]
MFSTYPDYDLIHQRIDQLVAKATDDGAKVQENASSKSAPKKKEAASKNSGEQSSAKSKPEVTQSSSEPSSEASLGVDDQVITTQRDGSPITEKYLQELEYVGDTGRIEQIAQNNDSCKAG